MVTPTVYVICDQNCKFEGMTKEQIYAAIVQAVNEGTIGDIDTGFITTVKTINGTPLKFFVGEQSAYNELTEDEKQDLFALITNDTSKEAIEQAIEELQAAEEAHAAAIQANTEAIEENTRAITNLQKHNFLLAGLGIITSGEGTNTTALASGVYLAIFRKGGDATYNRSGVGYIAAYSSDTDESAVSRVVLGDLLLQYVATESGCTYRLTNASDTFSTSTAISEDGVLMLYKIGVI